MHNLKGYMSEQDSAIEEEELKRQALLIARVRDIKESEGFKELINLILDISNFNGNNYAESKDDFAYNEGRRSVFYDLLATLEEIDPTFYPRLLLTRAEENQNDNDSE